MNLYRLLRNNKETGPHTQEEMIALGFKPYDLIWVEGKSAGWRYPSEIPEFKSMAPVIEEQPFDRFYKKAPAAATKEMVEEVPVSVAEPVVMARETEKTTRERVFQQPAYNTATRHIHVTLPSGNTVNLTTINNSKEPVQRQPVPAVSEERLSFTETISRPYQTPKVNETIPVLKEKKTMPGERIVEQPYYPPQTHSSFSWTMIAGLFVGIATLVGLGVMIGLSINRENKNIALKESTNTKPRQVVIQPENANTSNPVASPPAATETEPLNESSRSLQQSLPQPPDKNLVKNAVVLKEVPAQDAVVKENKPGEPADRQPQRRTDTKRPEGEDINAAENNTALKRNAIILPAVNIEKQLNIKTNLYKVGAFGGISDLQCTLVNDSKFALDVVEVELTYIQANDKVFKTETLAFKDVAAGAQITINAPKSTRGIKVLSRITKVSPKESGLSKI